MRRAAAAVRTAYDSAQESLFAALALFIVNLPVESSRSNIIKYIKGDFQCSQFKVF